VGGGGGGMCDAGRGRRRAGELGSVGVGGEGCMGGRRPRRGRRLGSRSEAARVPVTGPWTAAAAPPALAE
jgi:hypothetical protein